MPKQQEYICSTCERDVGKLHLLAKRVEYREVGKGGATIKSRTVAWLCNIPQEDGSPSCVEQDADWHRPIYGASPGMNDTVLSEELESDEPVADFPVEELLGLDDHLRKAGLR